jgi:hypothetical protein
MKIWELDGVFDEFQPHRMYSFTCPLTFGQEIFSVYDHAASAYAANVSCQNNKLVVMLFGMYQDVLEVFFNEGDELGITWYSGQQLTFSNRTFIAIWNETQGRAVLNMGRDMVPGQPGQYTITGNFKTMKEPDLNEPVYPDDCNMDEVKEREEE